MAARPIMEHRSVARRAGRSCGRLVGLAGATGLILLPVLAACSRDATARAAVQRDAAAAVADTLRVCADPNNLPFSNAKEQGFENRIVDLLAAELHEPVSYTWWAERRGFIRNTLKAHRCDLVVGIPEGDDMVLATTPYYRSTYVFVSRKDRGLHIQSLDDPRLHRLEIGMHVIGDDGNALPPGLALARRGIIRNVKGYSIYGNYAKPNPPADLIDAVAKGHVDVAIAWGPLAGYFARHEPVPLEITPVSPPVDGPAAHFVYSISLGVRHGDTAFKAQLERALVHRRGDIRRILTTYGVPLVDDGGHVALAPTARTTCQPSAAEATCE